MKDFEKCLVTRSYTQKSIIGFVMRVKLFAAWLKDNNLDFESASYNDLLSYIGHLQKIGKSKISINHTLRSLEHYYKFLSIDNIALNVRIRGTYHEQVLLLDPEDLLHIYDKYTEPTKAGYFRYSNHLILGLMIFQALDMRDMLKLELANIDLNKGKLYVPGGSRRKNERFIPLQAHQIIPLHDYIYNYRGLDRKGQICAEHSDKLFHPNGFKEHRMLDQFKILSKVVKQQNPEINIKRLSQLRQSRIASWIEQLGLRKAQYLSGYKHISNIEKYRGMDMRDLSKQIEIFHPLGGKLTKQYLQI